MVQNTNSSHLAESGVDNCLPLVLTKCHEKVLTAISNNKTMLLHLSDRENDSGFQISEEGGEKTE